MARKGKRKHLHGELLFNVTLLLHENLGKNGEIWVDHETGQKYCSYPDGCSDHVIADRADPKGQVSVGAVRRYRVQKYGLLKRQPKPKVKVMKAASRSMSSKEATDLYKAMRDVIDQNKEMRKNIALLLSSLLPAKQVVLDLDNKSTDIYKVD
jgi:hypothetical protein